MPTTSNEYISIKHKTRIRFQTACIWILVTLLAVSAIAVRESIMTAPVRGLLVGTLLFGIFTGIFSLLRLFKTHHHLLYPALFFVMLFATCAILASKPHNIESLRHRYTDSLRAFDNTKYIWGGETENGIDCSGLARTALWQAMLKEGAVEMNPRLLGPAFWKFWWRDMSAKAMGEGVYGYTRVVGHAPKLAGYNTSKLHEGDMAIASGIHVLIYCGNKQWIEANPDDQKVVINTAPKGSKRGWFNVPVTFVRWWML